MGVYKPSAILLGISIFLLVAGVVLYLCIPYIIYAKLSKQLPFTNDSLSFKIWRDIPLPIYQKIYFFNITNGDDFLNHGDKPNFEEVGPYTYSSNWHKDNISWNENGTISFREIKVFHFERNMSVGSDDDIIHSINGPMVVAATLAEKFGIGMKIAINLLFLWMKEKLLIQRSVKELTYTGYKDVIILLAPFFDRNLPYHDGKFSWLYKKNGTDDGLFNVFTGHSDLEKINAIDKYNGENTLLYWKEQSCGMFNGSNGELNPPLSDNRQTLHVYQTELCRSWPLKYNEPSEILNIPAKRFIGDKKLLENGTDNPVNECYNVGKNLPSGALDISPCQFGAPAVLSYPHFYLADQSYRSAVSGMSPDASKHSFFIDIEPTSGFAVNAAVRVQLNLYLKRIKGIWPFSEMPSTPLVFPILWQELTLNVTDELAQEFKDMIIKPMLYAKISSFVIIGIGALLTISALIFVIILYKKQKLKENDDVAPLCIDDTDDIHGQTNDVIKENGKIEAHDDDEPAIRDV